MNSSKSFDEPLLTTEFFLPVSSHPVISRARLFTLLDEGLTRPLTLISASAGSGKSTLVVSAVTIAASGPRPVVATVGYQATLYVALMLALLAGALLLLTQRPPAPGTHQTEESIGKRHQESKARQ